MAHISLYRKYRPVSWDKVIGQGHIVTTLINQIKSGSVSHAYLFTGTRGTGKTSSAKIFARAVNCLSPKDGSPCGKCSNCIALEDATNMDILEMDAASNNGVDEIRELKENILYPPTVGKYKVFIIDEVHMLSPSAFNALLKTLEEPPSHAIFILATTEAQKLPQTIISRCMRFDFRLVSKKVLTERLQYIFSNEQYDCEVKAAEEIATHAEGRVRDMLSIADMCMSYSPNGLTLNTVLEVLGTSDFETLYKLSSAILSSDIKTILETTEGIYEKGKSPFTTAKELTSFLRDVLIIKNVEGFTANYNDEKLSLIKSLSSSSESFKITRAMEILSSLEAQLRYSSLPSVLFDASLVRAATLRTENSQEALSARVRELEKELEILSNKLSGFNATDILTLKTSSTQGSIKSDSFTPLDSQAKEIGMPNSQIDNSDNNRTESKEKAFKAEDNSTEYNMKSDSPISYSQEVSTASKTEISLESVATEISLPPIFAEENQNSEDDFRALEIWGKALPLIRERINNLTYFALKSEDNVSINGNSFILSLKDEAVRERISKEEVIKEIGAIIKELLGSKFSFELKEGKAQSAGISNETRLTLKDIFGSKFVDKTLK